MRLPFVVFQVLCAVLNLTAPAALSAHHVPSEPAMAHRLTRVFTDNAPAIVVYDADGDTSVGVLDFGRMQVCFRGTYAASRMIDDMGFV